jgi:hypothetical protein
MAEFPVTQEIKQQIFLKGSVVFFTAFTKTRATGKLERRLYFCEGIVVEEPSQYTRAPHKVQILKVAFGLSKIGCSEQDGRTLLKREIYLPSSELQANIPLLLAKTKWWFD